MATRLTQEQFRQQFGDAGLSQFGIQASQQSRFQETLQDIRQTGSNILNRFRDAGKSIQETSQRQVAGETNVVSGFLQSTGAIGGAITQSIGDVITGIVKGTLSQEQENAVKIKVAETATSVLENPAVSFVVKQHIKAFQESSPETQRNLEGIFNIAMLGLDVAGAGAGVKTAQKTFQISKQVVSGVGEGIQATGRIGQGIKQLGQESIGKVKQVLPGVKQQAIELSERFPRAAERVKQAGQEAAERAVKIQESSPAISNAIKSNLDNRIINTVIDADDVTRQGFKEIVDIAETTGKKLGVKERPEIVAGRAAEEQFKLIAEQRKVIGKQIGEAVDKLSKTTKVNIKPEINLLKSILIENGGKLTKKGWVFKGKITKSETAKINELWSEVQKGVKGLTPREVRDFDQLFSKLQRETRLEGLGDIRVDTPDGNKSLFGVFRDVFSKKLDTLSSEIRGLNKEFREIVIFIEDIENSIIKSGNFKTIKDIGEAEFAQTNLRRLLSDAQSAAAFREIADKMDELARILGYTGAKPEDLIAFATEIRKIFPDVIPPTSFTGGIRTGLKPSGIDIAEKVLRAGIPDVTDQQKALKELLNSL